MDDSFMSISSFEDDDNIIFNDEVMFVDDCDSSVSSKRQKKTSAAISALFSAVTSNSQATTTKPVNVQQETPKQSSSLNGCSKRKKTARRCLSTDLNKFSDKLDGKSNEFKKPLIILTPIKSTPILSSIENTLISPQTGSPKPVEIVLTPEFNDLRNENRCQGSENSSWSQRRTKSILVPLKPSARLNRGKGTLFKSLSDYAHANIKEAVQISCLDRNLIGDCSQHHILPLLESGKHTDLKSITCHVLADLLNGKYLNSIESFSIVDCRYPYEYQAGHIRSAINLYTQESILSTFLETKASNSKPSEDCRRNILIFHCEFSSERGPNLCRFLRNNDRLSNISNYPKLHYPEIYLLEGGYKEFFTNYSVLCEPKSYLPMHAKEFESELRKFRSIVKTKVCSFNSRSESSSGLAKTRSFNQGASGKFHK